ncbi:MAG: D-tyrosyl-tRNA(Tyr) deacylase [Rhodobacterales bacterium]|nr:D-tyrosyl-tRNA(Tyr) deacylase [Rhodobacterales bacterium]
MRAVVQRVAHATVTVEGEVVGAIQGGMLILLGVGPTDQPADAVWLAKKIAGLRIFNDENGKMNLSLADCSGAALVVSQFTLYGDCRKGRRPSFVGAAHPSLAKPMYEQFCIDLAAQGVQHVQRGVFGADMKVELLNDGPVTLIIDSP